MPIVQTTIWLCEACGKTEVVTIEVGMYDDPVVKPPSNVPWDYHDENLCCPTCIKRLGDPEKKIPPEHREVAEYLKTRVLETKQQKITEKTILAWCNDIRLMIKQDGRKLHEIAALIKECHDMEPRGPSNFTWRNNILSMSKLRLRWNEGKIYLGMNSPVQSNSFGRREVDNQELARQMQHDSENL